eukprot:12461043-Alexandrium_andersonii.AAC.1
MHGGPPEERACAAQRARGTSMNADALARALLPCRAGPIGHERLPGSCTGACWHDARVLTALVCPETRSGVVSLRRP